MEEEHKEEQKEIISKKINLTEKIRENPWILSTFICGVLVLVLFLSTFTNLTGNTISEKDASEKLLGFYKSMGIEGLTLNSVKEVSGVYEVSLNYQDKIVPLYITKDGKNIIDSLSPIEPISSNTNTQQKEIPKSDKPSVELYVFTYCPYGLQMEKAMIPVVNLLKDKINFKIRQIGAMHGEYEKIEAERQLCIEKEYPSKFLDYVLAFAEDTSIGDCKGDATCLVPKLTALYSKLGIDSSKIDSCMKTDGENLYNAEVKNAQSKGISGSPTTTINGVEASIRERSPEATKGIICNVFNNIPSECSQALSASSASAGFGKGTSSSSSSASCN